MTDIEKHFHESIALKQELLRTMIPTIEDIAKRLAACLNAGNKLIFFGNGGSASDSQHLAAEFVGRYEKERRALAAISLTVDTSALTAIANDYGFERVFERQLEALGRKGDVAFAISTSGNSKNVIAAVKRAKQMGVFTVGLLGNTGGQLRALVDIPVVIPSTKTSRIQESHIMMGHILCECVDELIARG